MRVLVTGGAGFIGSHVCDALYRAGHLPFVIDDLSTGKIENVANYTTREGHVNIGSICDVDYVNNIIVSIKPHAIVHLAAQAAISTSIENPVRDLEVNAKGTLNLIQATLKYGVKRFVFASTSAVYDESRPPGKSIDEYFPIGPNTPYGISKLAAEGYVRTLFPFATILRFANVIGSRQVPIGENQVLSRMIRHFKYGDKFYIHGSGHQKRDFIYVTDVADAIISSLRREDGSYMAGTYNIGTGEAHSVNEMANIVEKYYGVPGYKWDHTDQEDPRGYVCLNISSAKAAFGWEPKVKFYQAVNQTIDWWESLK